MARLCRRKAEIVLVLEEIVFQLIFMMAMMYTRYRALGGTNVRRIVRYRIADRIPKQIIHMNDLVGVSDIDCYDNLRMNRATFNRLCNLLRHSGGLVDSKYVSVPEMVAYFLSVLAHHSKIKCVKFDFKRSGQTVSKHFHNVLNVVLRLHGILLSTPTPVDDDCTHPAWRHFKGCLGALDGTYIDVTVPDSHKPRYRTRKGSLSVNVFAACDRNMCFIYMLIGWEGSDADARVLRDAVSRANGLRVPQGKFYLCDNGYTNGEGFLTPYKMVRYHLSEWGNGPSTPQNYKEYYNMYHSKARNVIEQTFRLLNKRWAVLRSPSFYPIKVQNRMILACGLLHNFILTEMPDDPLLLDEDDVELHNKENEEGGFIDSINPSQAWKNWRDNLTHQMFANWSGGH